MFLYHSLFSVRCKHNFYFRGETQDLKFVPTPECKIVMKNYGLLFKASGNGFNVLYQEENGIEHLLTLIKESLKFSFFILKGNPLFLNFTELPLPDPDSNPNQIYHFSNRNGRVEGDLALLHQDKQVSEADLVTLVQPTFQFSLPVEGSEMPKQLSMEDEEGMPIAAIPFEGELHTSWTLPPSEDIKLVTLNLRNEATGRYVLKLDGQDALHCYAADINPIQCFGMMDIHFGNKAKDGLELIKDSVFTPKEYLLDFNARSTHLKYFIIVQNRDQYGKPEILKEKKPASFSKPDEVTLKDGTLAYMLRSRNPIPLAQVPKEKFQLKLADRGGNSPLVIDLPSPDSSQIKPEPDEKSLSFCSEMFVYI